MNTKKMDINYNELKVLKRGQTVSFTNIYVLIDPENGVIRYVGKSDNVNNRLKEHIRKSNISKTHKNNWINSLKRKGLIPIVEVIDVVPISEWGFWEQYWIDLLKSWNIKLTNIALGGQGGNLGFEVNQKIAKLKLGVPRNETTKIKLAEHHTGLKATQETKNKMSLSKIGDKNGMFGRKQTEKMKKTIIKSISQLTLDGELIKCWDSIIDASNSLKINRCSIADVCHNRKWKKTAGGYKWRFNNI